MTCDILFSVPWCCGEKDCKQQWHSATYWIDGRGYTVDRYSDGDHETCRKRDLPSMAEHDAAIREYHEYVARTGLDPLGDFFVERETKRVRKYSATFTDSIGGLMLVSVKTAGGRKVPLGQMPDELRSYLNVEAKGRNFYQRDFANVAECRTVAGGKVRRIHGRCDATFTCEVEFRVPKNPKVVAAALRKAARRSLNGKDGE